MKAIGLIASNFLAEREKPDVAVCDEGITSAISEEQNATDDFRSQLEMDEIKPIAYKPHLAFAHRLWKENVLPGDIVIDATCGNGQDTLALAVLSPAKLYAIDIQEKAISNTRQLLSKYSDITYICGCHSQFPEAIAKGSVKLVVYNLGYLPRGDKAKTTRCETTLTSIKAALALLSEQGLLCITCYPGHPEGKREEDLLLAFAANLDKQNWHCSHHRWINRAAAPSVLLMQK